MVEINPLVRTDEDEMIALDAKIGFDDNADFRHPEIFEGMRNNFKDFDISVDSERYDKLVKKAEREYKKFKKDCNII